LFDGAILLSKEAFKEGIFVVLFFKNVGTSLANESFPPEVPEAYASALGNPLQTNAPPKMRMKYCMQYRMLELQHIIDDKMHIYIPVSSSIMMCTIYYDMICMIYRCLLLIVYDLNIYCTSGKCKLNLAIHLAIKRQVDQCQCSRPAMVP